MSMQCIRRFNSTGIGRFRGWLAEARDNPNLEPPWTLLTAEDATESVEPTASIDRPGFVTKHDSATYLQDKLSALPIDTMLRDQGIWTWLSLFYFDDICPAHGAARKVNADYYYIYEVGQALYHYRHLLRVSFEVMRRAPDHNRLFLDSPVYRLGSVTEKVMRRLFLTRIDTIFEVMDRLYFDHDKGRPKRGIADHKPRRGDLINRLPRRVQQLQRTYDLNVVDANRLLELLGPEFRHWHADPELPGLEQGDPS